MRLAIVPGREVERVADLPVALVAGEEAVEDLAAVAPEASASASCTESASSSFAIVSSTPDGSGSSPGCSRAPARIVSRQSRRVSCASQGRIAASSRSFGRFSYARAKTSWKTSSASASRQAERLDRDRVHVAGEAIDELAPRVVVSRAAAGDELCVGFGDGARIKHSPNESATCRPVQSKIRTARRDEQPCIGHERASPARGRRGPRGRSSSRPRARSRARRAARIARRCRSSSSRRQLLVRVQRLEDGEADFAVVELGRRRHGKRCFRPFCAPP